MAESYRVIAQIRIGLDPMIGGVGGNMTGTYVPRRIFGGHILDSHLEDSTAFVGTFLL